VRQGDQGDRFYLIANNQAEVIREGPDHAEVLGMLGQLDYFGERALLGNVVRAATATHDLLARLTSCGLAVASSRRQASCRSAIN
jgi:hypothetical protein